LLRRAFIELSNDPASAARYESQVAAGITVGEASSLLSALLFIDLDVQNHASMYLDPRATNDLFG
jgi:hypothetical protein